MERAGVSVPEERILETLLEDLGSDRWMRSG
jgi:hypothetical protein